MDGAGHFGQIDAEAFNLAFADSGATDSVLLGERRQP
jgi:hypothetical protein